eukprot:TRINITY_DN15362_c0_g1_i3.p1 TRINITY_DN15362_c0_g1~~TRINITY_DN15362_c0_g1_i3.p1  ORF type:complete len:505 (-),score=84.30 TRINITY_DN15362_c0_g1_i3:19-1533(-)
MVVGLRDSVRLLTTLCLTCAHAATTSQGVDVTLLVRSQNTPHDKALVSELTAAAVEAGWPHTSVVSMLDVEKEFHHNGLWTYVPWIYLTESKWQSQKRRTLGGQRWLVFLEPSTSVNFRRLAEALAKHDAKKPLFLGHSIKDTESTIIHHYSTEPPYPHVHAGFALSSGLLKMLWKDLEKNPLGGNQQIEPVWELAKWIKTGDKGGERQGVALTDMKDVFCLSKKAGCATWPISRDEHRMSFGLRPADVLIAVKTVSTLQGARIPLIHEFWASSSEAEVIYLSNEGYDGVKGANVINLTPEFGDMVDPAKESTSQGSGHCSKMEAILQYLSKHHPGKRWYVVTDDDTLLNVPRLLEVLNSYNHKKPIYLGERYGWAHREKYAGTNYITTGGGMALSAAALTELMACTSCTCRAANQPDDMSLGQWFRDLDIPATHEEGFHQSEPHNYHPDVLRTSDQVISFHRFATSRLPGGATEEKKHEHRRKSWGEWKKKYFTGLAPKRLEL